eukprot:Hpha_TRINITY_DN12809_c0_g1::TRINITY_DN12809_c0_g1_i1::g.24021::m.24021
MGGDGGVIANNRRFMPQTHMSNVKDSEERDRLRVDRERWSRCHLSKLPLCPPLVADDVGNIYNKEAVLSAMQTKQVVSPFVKGLRDVNNLRPQPNPAKQAVHASLKAGEEDGVTEALTDLWCCPVTQATTNGVTKFMFGKTCGCVFAARAAVQIGGGSECPACGAPSSTDYEDITSVPNLLIPLCPDKQSSEALVAKMTKRRELLKEMKKAGKKAGEPCAKRRRKDDSISLVSIRTTSASSSVPTVGRDAPPPGADPDVWRQLFRAPQKGYDGENEDFLRRSGMLGPSHKAA